MADEDPPGFEDGSDTVAFRQPVSGQPVPVPRELALAESRPFKAYNMHLGGVKWEVIARDLGYADERAVQYDVARYLETARSLYNSFTLTQQRALALARLESLLSATWSTAMGGNLPAVREAHGLVASTIKLLRLDEAHEEDAGGDAGTVIIGGTEEEYVAGLEKAAEG